MVKVNKIGRNAGAVSLALSLLTIFSATLYAGSERVEPPLPELHRAVISGELSKVKSLIERGADINKLDPHMGNSALHIAAQTDHTDIVKYLIEQGAFVNLQTPRSGFTPLMVAAWYSKSGNIQALFSDPEVNINLQTRTGAKAEDMVGGWDRNIEPQEAERYAKLAELFKQKREQLNRQVAEQKILNTIEDPSLTDAAKAKAVARLIGQGQDVNQRRPVYSSRNDWHTPLLVASREGDVEVVEVLLKHGADQTIPGYPMDAIAMHKAGYMGYPAIVKLLVEDKNGYKVLNAQGPNNGYTPLHDAIWHGNTKAAKAYIEGGASLSLTTYENDTPKALAERYQYQDIVTLIEQSK